MRKLVILATFFMFAAVFMTGCFHATVETGLDPSAKTINIPWANSFVFGLVPPPTVAAAAKCPGGVAKVETQRSFLNGLVGILTLQIYTPMAIKVTCAEVNEASELIGDAPEVSVSQAGGITNALDEAADLAMELGGPVIVRFDY